MHVSSTFTVFNSFFYTSVVDVIDWFDIEFYSMGSKNIVFGLLLICFCNSFVLRTIDDTSTTDDILV